MIQFFEQIIIVVKFKELHDMDQHFCELKNTRKTIESKNGLCEPNFMFTDEVII